MKLAKAVLVLDGKAEYLLSDASTEGLTASGWVINGGWHLTITGLDVIARPHEGRPIRHKWTIKPHVSVKLIDASAFIGDYNEVLADVQDVLDGVKEWPSKPDSYVLEPKHLEEA